MPRGITPSIAIGLGVRIAPDRRHVTVFVLDSTSRQTLVNVRGGRPIAVVFTNSASARALQVKARSAVVAARVPGDDERIGAYADALAHEWADHGQQPGFAYGVLCRAPGEVVALELAPYVVFDQSPGPRAGAVITVIMRIACGSARLARLDRRQHEPILELQVTGQGTNEPAQLRERRGRILEIIDIERAGTDEGLGHEVTKPLVRRAVDVVPRGRVMP